jgi:hypothetical protein
MVYLTPLQDNMGVAIASNGKMISELKTGMEIQVVCYSELYQEELRKTA